MVIEDKIEKYLNESTQSSKGKKDEEKFRKSQMESAVANFYDIYMEKPDKEMLKELQYSLDDTIEIMKKKGAFQ